MLFAIIAFVDEKSKNKSSCCDGIFYGKEVRAVKSSTITKSGRHRYVLTMLTIIKTYLGNDYFVWIIVSFCNIRCDLTKSCDI